ncbi:MAG: sugar phosphate nucleotidyltransferase [Cyanobacteria bacterium J06639_1]
MTDPATTVRRAFIPAAGLGTRLHPVTRVVPKELLPVGSVPLIHRAIAECTRGGVREIVLVTSPTKQAVANYAREVCKELGCDLVCVEQPQPKGVGDAMLLAEPHLAGEPFVFYMPDEVCFCPTSPIAALVEAYDRFRHPVLALTWLTPEVAPFFQGTGRLETVKISDRHYRVTALLDKVRDRFPVAESGSLKGVGIGIVNGEFIELLNQYRMQVKGDREFDDLPVWQHLVKAQRLLGVVTKGLVIDAGHSTGFAAANQWWLTQQSS